MTHIRNFDSFLNEAKIGDMILSSEDLIQMLTGESSKKLDPEAIGYMLLDPSAFTKLVVAVFSGGPKDGFLVMKNINNAIKELLPFIGYSSSISNPEAKDMIKASYQNLVDMFFEEYPQFSDDDEEIMNFTAEVDAKIQKSQLGKQIATTKAEIAKMQDGLNKMIEEYDSISTDKITAARKPASKPSVLNIKG